MRRPACALVLFLAGLGAAQAAPAAQAPADPVPLPPVAPPTLEVAPALPPYQTKLDRLAELLGTLAYLRDLCGKKDGIAWHNRMDDLLAAEGDAPGRRERLAGSYNRGYTGYRLTYRSCTPAAEAVMVRATREGAQIAADVDSRFGTP